MEISLTASGVVNQACPEGKWRSLGDDSIAHSAFFAGSQMYAFQVEEGSSKGAWELRYMGFKLSALSDAAEAMAHGPEFAKRVLGMLSSNIGGGTTSVSSSDPVDDLSRLIDSCGAFPDELSRMKVLIGMIRDQTEILREGILSLNPEEQLAREAHVMDRLDKLSGTIRGALRS